MDGVIAAVPTPIDARMRPVKELFVEHGKWALTSGCDGLNILGSTGEANSFDGATRQTLMGWAADAFPKERLMVGTGTPSLAETIELTEVADDLGYRVALVLPPYYYKPLSETGLIAWYAALHHALGARAIEVYFYNFPQMTGITIPVAVIAELSTLFPKRFTGIKDSSGDLDYCRAIAAAKPSMRVFPSSETALAGAKSAGFAGCISATVNLTAPLCQKVWSAPGDIPSNLTDAIARQRGALAGPTLIAAVKHMVSVRSQEVTWRNVLPPFLPLDEAEARTLQTTLQSS